MSYFKTFRYEVDPAIVRREIQCRYDDYMRGDRLLLGIQPTALQKKSPGDNPEARQQYYDQFADTLPRKSRSLGRCLAKELVFIQTCEVMHDSNVTRLHLELYGSEGHSPKLIPFTYLSGFGRNACKLTLFHVGDGIPMGKQSAIIPGAQAEELVKEGGVGTALILDPDCGLGRITGATPEIYHPVIGDLQLANSALDTLVAA